VPAFGGFTPEFERRLRLDPEALAAELAALRDDTDQHGAVLHDGLKEIYSYELGYRDSPCFFAENDEQERRLSSAKIAYERELIDGWLPAQRGWSAHPDPAQVNDQRQLARALREVAADNLGVDHPLYDYLATEASAQAIRLFLHNEVVRNEVVDDEVALLVGGTQGLLKSAVSINLFDECGRGTLKHFHTYWLRMLLEELGWEALAEYRSRRPWFAGITSNDFMMLLTRPSYRMAAYGYFLITEGWVPPHFEKLLAGKRRTGFGRDGRDIYFTAHVEIDPTHTEELIVAVENQDPAPEPHHCRQILGGVRIAIAGATAQYDRMLDYLRSLD
jgi:hypothetical protein